MKVTHNTRLAVFGGSFDPVHFGHLRLAECCQSRHRLDRVWFVPAASAPHKQRRAPAPAPDRAEMLELVLAEYDRFELCRIELDRGGVSYTVDTLSEIRDQAPRAELFLLLGADSLEDLPNWRRPAEICRIATPVVVRRPGRPRLDFEPLGRFLPPERVEEIRQAQVDMPACDISSTEIRRRVACGKSIEELTPAPVVDFIHRRGLYRGAVNPD